MKSSLQKTGKFTVDSHPFDPSSAADEVSDVEAFNMFSVWDDTESKDVPSEWLSSPSFLFKKMNDLAFTPDQLPMYWRSQPVRGSAMWSTEDEAVNGYVTIPSVPYNVVVCNTDRLSMVVFGQQVYHMHWG